MNRVRRFAEFFALKRNLVVLLIAIFVIGAGEELWMRFVPKYLQALGAGALVIGLYDGIRTLLGAIYAYPGGKLVDLWGHRRAFLTFNLLSIAGYALVLLIPRWGAVIVGMFLFLSWSCFSLPATLSMVAATLSTDQHATGVGAQSVIRRLPIMVAPILGGLLIDRFGIVPGVRIALIISIVLSASAFFAQRQIQEQPKEKSPQKNASWNCLRALREFDPPLRRLLLSDILVRFCERIPYAWVVIFAMDYIGMSGTQIGVLITVEMFAAILCIILSSHFADRSEREPFVIVTFAMFTLFPIGLLMSRSFAALVVAFMVRGFKEFGDSARKALIIGAAHSDRRGEVVGTYYLVRDLVVSLGAFVGAYLWMQGPALNLLGAAAFGIGGTIFYIRFIRQNRQESLDELKKALKFSRQR